MNKKAEYYIEKLELLSHPEGGYFKEIYRSEEKLNPDCLPNRYNNYRCFSTSIYHMLEGEQFSAFHRLQSDELWHFYDGSVLNVYIINPEGKLTIKNLGRRLESGEELQIIIPKQSWFAAGVAEKGSFTLMGCTVAPGFEFDDFELGERMELLKLFPEHKDLITKFTH